MSEQVFRHRHRVTYADCSAGNHVYYARFLHIFEEARGEFFRHLGTTFRQWQEQDTIFPVVECQVRYLAPARYDELLGIELWLTKAERARLNFAYRVLNEKGGGVAQGETFHVCTGLNDRPKRLPDDLRSRLNPWVKSGTIPV